MALQIVSCMCNSSSTHIQSSLAFPSYLIPSIYIFIHQGCGGGNSSHVRTFLHGGMRLTVSVVSLPVDQELAGDGQLWFWARPKGLQSEPLPSIYRTLLSPDAKCISLGQFLDLSCNARYLQVFDRQLHLEFVRYFGYGRTVACVYQDRIRPYSISLPRLKLDCGIQSLVNWLKDSHAELVQASVPYFELYEPFSFAYVNV